MNDPIYLPGVKEKWYTDDADIGLLINGEKPFSFRVYRPFAYETIQPVRDILDYLFRYFPPQMELYRANRLVVFVQQGRMLPELETLEAIPWPKNIIPLSENQNNRLILEGEAAAEIYDYFGEPSVIYSGSRQEGKVFIDQGIEYSVYVRPLLPHEHEENFPYNNEWQAKQEIILPFTCSKPK